MKETKTILLVVFLSCIAFVAVMCMPKREQTKQEIIQEYQKHQEAFVYVKDCFISNKVQHVFEISEGEIAVNTSYSDVSIPLENLHDKLLVKYVHLLFDDLDYLAIYNHSTWKENVMQLMFMKDTNKIYYYQDIIYCEDAQPPVSTSSVFYNAEQIDNYWFYCEEDTDEDLF
jgi:hypothetical protein